MYEESEIKYSISIAPFAVIELKVSSFLVSFVNSPGSIASPGVPKVIVQEERRSIANVTTRAIGRKIYCFIMIVFLRFDCMLVVGPL